MKVSEVRGMSLREAESKVIELKALLAKERAVVASGTRPENPGKIRALRRDVARFLTIINEKKKAGEKVPEILADKKTKEEKVSKEKELAKERKEEKKHKAGKGKDEKKRRGKHEKKEKKRNSLKRMLKKGLKEKNKR